MKDHDRKLMRRKLDVEMRRFAGGCGQESDAGAAAGVRLALRIPSREIAEKMGIRPSNVFEMEERERQGRIGIRR